MDLNTLQPLLDWIAAHPTWAGVAVLLIAMAESMLILGVLVPGALMMFGAGALVGAGKLPMVETLLWAMAGAVAGDSVSFWIGRYFKERLKRVWPFKHHPSMIARSEAFFQRHGGKSVLFGRFVGPVRAVIPAVAGMMGMPPGRFLFVNVVSAILWAPSYILPGVLFGASLGLAAQVGMRLALFLLVIVIVLWLTVWLARRLFSLLQPHAAALMERLLSWGRRHPYLGGFVTAALDPRRPEAPGLAAAGAFLVVTAWTAMSLGGLLDKAPPSATDTSVFNLLQGLRTPWADRIMLAISALGEPLVLGVVQGGGLLWLLWRRRILPALHWLAAGGFALVLAFALQGRAPSPLGPEVPWWDSSPLVLVCGVLGFLAVMMAPGIRSSLRWLVYAGAGAAVVAVAVAQLYLGGLWFSQALAGMVLGVAWVVLLGAAYRRHSDRPLAPAPLGGVVALSLVVAAGVYGSDYLEGGGSRYQHPVREIRLGSAAWQAGAWQRLPSHRRDLEGEFEQPLTLQWAGDLSAIRAALLARGWREPVALTPVNAVRWLQPDPPLEDLPVLPQVHDGRHEALLLIRPLPGTDREAALRLWPTAVRVDGAGRPLWVGNVSTLQAYRPLPWLTVPVTGEDFTTPLSRLARELADWQRRWVDGPGGRRTLLVFPP